MQSTKCALRFSQGKELSPKHAVRDILSIRHILLGMAEHLHFKGISLQSALPGAEERHEHMFMLSGSSEESSTYFPNNNFNALQQREGFYSIHIQSSSGCHKQISAQKRNSCSPHGTNHWRSLRSCSEIQCAQETPTNVERPRFPFEYVMKRN